MHMPGLLCENAWHGSDWRRESCIYNFFLQISAKGRTNMELREQFVLPEGVSQSMARFVSKSPSSNKSPASSSAGSTVSWSGRSASSASGPIVKVSVWNLLTFLTTMTNVIFL